MAYVRQRGNQVAIVHGVRDATTRKVEQQVLFTLYSREEATLALGKPHAASAERFQRMLQGRHPALRFDWAEIRRGIKALLPTLPETYDERPKRLRARFRSDLSRFARQLVALDPEFLPSAQTLLAEQRFELEYLQELLAWRLERRSTPATPGAAHHELFWSLASEDDVPPDVEEHAEGYYARREYERATAIFTLLTESFEDYAEGHNYLGLIALDQRRLDDALGHFQRTIEVGRRLFPARVAKDRWWRDLATRPYMRGLRNLTLTMVHAGRYDEALALCDRLAQECHDELTAAAHRASAYLNTGRWQKAREAALYLQQISPGESLVAALAAYELGLLDDARVGFVHAMLNVPRSVAMVLGVKLPAAPQGAEVADHNSGITLRHSLAGYLATWRPAARRFFQDLWRAEPMVRSRVELAEVTHRRMKNGATDDRRDYDRITRMTSLEFAREAVLPKVEVPETRARTKPRTARRQVH